MRSFHIIAPIRRRAAPSGARVSKNVGLRVRRRPGVGSAVITPRLVAGVVVALVSAVLLLCGHSGVGMLVVLIGMCFVGIAGHNA
jgi:hypothetical protein